MKNKGFTLVELLVVVTIIVLLAAMIIPACYKVLHKSNSVVCTNNLRQIWLSGLAYELDYQKYPMFENLTNYTGLSIWKCPGDKRSIGYLWRITPLTHGDPVLGSDNVVARDLAPFYHQGYNGIRSDGSALFIARKGKAPVGHPAMTSTK